MNPEVRRLRVVLHATRHAVSPDGACWSGVADLRAELNSGAIEHYVIRSGTYHATKAAAIEAAREAFVRDMMAARPAPPVPRIPPTASPWADCYM